MTNTYVRRCFLMPAELRATHEGSWNLLIDAFVKFSGTAARRGVMSLSSLPAVSGGRSGVELDFGPLFSVQSGPGASSPTFRFDALTS